MAEKSPESDLISWARNHEGLRGIPYFFPLPNRNDMDRKGCDICFKNKPTEKFVGYRGGVVWICEKCYDEIRKAIEVLNG